MLPIVGYPSVVNFGLSAFKEVFSRPQSRHFGEYVTGLMVCTNRTVQGINDSFLAHCDQSALNNFLTDSPWNDVEFDELRYKFVNLRLRELGLEDGVVVVDDTISHHTGKHMEGAGWHYDVAEGKTMWGHQLVTTHYVRQWASVPLDFRIYIKREQAGKDFKTKLELAADLIKHAVEKGVPFSCVVFDSWYFTTGFVLLVEELGKDWVTRCKCNRLILLSGKWTPLSEWAKSLPEGNFEQVVLKRGDGSKATYYACTKTVRMRGFEGRKLRIVVSYDEEKFERREDPYFYCTNNLNWETRRIMQTYARRFEIDTFYRDAKQNLGLEEYELRKLRGVSRHLKMVFVAHTLLTLGSKDRAVEKAVIHLETMGSACRRAFTEILHSFIQAVLEVGKKVKDAGQILRMLSSSRKQLRKMMKGVQ